MIPLEMANQPQEIERSDLPALTVDAIEGLADRLGATRGLCRIELEFDQGIFKVAWLHKRITTGQLREIDVAAGAVPAPE
jgi:hypothetical protein